MRLKPNSPRGLKPITPCDDYAQLLKTPCIVHHCGKAARGDAFDALFGSTAIFGGVDTAIVLKAYEHYRTVQSRQKYGSDWEETVLEFDPDSRDLSLGVEKSEAEVARIAGAILDYLTGCENSPTRREIEAHVEGRTKHKREALKTLCKKALILESGTGKKGDPLTFSLPISPGAADSSQPKGNTPDAPEKQPEGSVDSCPQVYTGTREQETQNLAETRVNTERILVPEDSVESVGQAGSREQESLTAEAFPKVIEEL